MEGVGDDLQWRDAVVSNLEGIRAFAPPHDACGIELTTACKTSSRLPSAALPDFLPLLAPGAFPFCCDMIVEVDRGRFGAI